MNFEYTPPQTELERAFGGFYSINAFGSIESGDDKHFEDFLDRLEIPPRVDVYIDSPGGHVEPSINIGKMIRDHWFSPHVGRYIIDHQNSTNLIKARTFQTGCCMSAATLMFLGGRLRYFDENSQFGVHQFSFRNPSPGDVGRSQILSAKIAKYVAEMGISSAFLEISSKTDSRKIELLSYSLLDTLGVVTGGQTPVTWSLVSLEDVLYVRGERDNLWGHHKMLLGFTKAEGFFVYAVIETQGRDWELTNFPVAELVLGNTEDVVIDLSARCGRSIEGAYANIHARISPREAHDIAYSDGFGIRVRASTEAPVFLGIGPMSTEGGGQMLQTFYKMFS